MASSQPVGPVSTTKQTQPLSTVLPPLIFGTATLNYQFNVDPYALNPNTLVSHALHSGIRAFDTSPYYGPAEEILGAALHSPLVTHSPTLSLKRSDYFLLTKAGRIANDVFDYSPEWIRHSVKRSLRRLGTAYLDVVYLHDVEFVSAAEVLAAVKELRRLRDEEGVLHYVGICGYPVSTLCSLAELIKTSTGEPLDIVQSYANYTIQNQRLLTHGLHRLIAAGIDVVTNASPLGMGLLRRQGPPVGAMGNWHPAPDGLRAACAKAAKWSEETQSERLEIVAVRFAMESWMHEGARVGSYGPLPNELTVTHTANSTPSTTSVSETGRSAEGRRRVGVSVIGVSTLEELTETLRVHSSVIDGLTDDSSSESTAAEATNLTLGGDTTASDDWSVQRRQRVRQLARTIRKDIIGKEWADFAWDSPEPGFVNQRTVFGVSPTEQADFDRME